jgi:hypothetical protein
MKKSNLTTFILTIFITTFLVISCNEKETEKKESENNTEQHDHNKMMHNMKMEKDNRISLNMSSQQAQHQLMNMRNHLVAVQSIIEMIANDNYDEASKMAHDELGLTPEMKMMCTSFDNPEFVELGLGFHKSADTLGNVLTTKNKMESLQALSKTIGYCVNCHATFKQ